MSQVSDLVWHIVLSAVAGPCICDDAAPEGEGVYVLQVEDEELPAHRIILTARSPVFRALLNSEMREGKEGVVNIGDVRAPVFRTLLHFVYTDMLPEVRSPALCEQYQNCHECP